MSWTHQISFPPKGIQSLLGHRHDDLHAENVRLRELLNEAAVNAERLRTKAGLDAIENEDAVRLQRLLIIAQRTRWRS